MEQRTCASCGETKAIEDFHRDSRSTGGRRASCKTCRSESVKAWYYRNADRQRARQRERAAENREQIRVDNRERYWRERDHRTDYAKRQAHERRARKFGVEVESGITIAALRERYGDRCCYCERVMSFELLFLGGERDDRATFEHVVPMSRGGGHTWENVRLACWDCNRAKGKSQVDEWDGARRAG